MKKTKRILIITGWFPNEFETSKGIFTKKIVEAQLKYTNCSITIICPIPYFPKINFSFIPEKFKNSSKIKYYYLNEGYKVYHPKYLKLPSPLSDKIDWYAYYKAVLKTIKREKINFDIIHSHGLFPDSYSAALISTHFSTPLVVHLHDSFLNLIYKKFPRKIDFILKTMTKILPVSHFQSQILLDTVSRPDIKNKISVVYNGVDLDAFKIEMNAQKDIDHFRVIFIGNNYKGKGLSTLLHSIAILKAYYVIKLDIIGDDKDKPEFVELIENIGLKGYVNFKGNIPNDKLPALIPDYNILVLPSEFETFGIVLIEAMACGIPVIATNVTAIPEIVSDEEVGILFSPGNIEELAKALEKAINKKWNKQYIHKHAMKFSIEETANNIEKIYDSILFNN